MKLLVTEATRSTVTGPCKLGSAVPKFSIWISGVIVSPGERLEGTRQRDRPQFGQRLARHLHGDRLADVIRLGHFQHAVR